MIPNPKTIDEVVAKFVFNNLPTISGDPDNESLNETIRQLYANTTTLPTTVDGGKHGHVGLIMKDAMYAKLEMETPREETDNIVAIPTIAANATVAQRQQANETYGKAI